MEMIIGQRGIGKTKKLIQAAYENNGTIVCKNIDRMAEKARAYGFASVKLISYDEFLKDKVWETSTENFYIRKVEELLERMNVVSFTLSTEE